MPLPTLFRQDVPFSSSSLTKEIMNPSVLGATAVPALSTSTTIICDRFKNEGWLLEGAAQWPSAVFTAGPEAEDGAVSTGAVNLSKVSLMGPGSRDHRGDLGAPRARWKIPP